MQMVSSRSAQASVSTTRVIAIVRSTRRAVVSGTMPMPTWHSTRRQTESKLRSWTRRRGERMVARHHQHEAVLAERIGLERARIDGRRHDAEIGHAFRDQANDLVAQ